MKKRIPLILFSLFIAVSQLLAQGGNQIRITGKVSDKITGEPIPGVTVSIKGSKTGVITLLDGTYSIMVPKATTDLVFTFIGYENETVAINDKRNIDVALKSAVKELGEMEITAQAKGQMAARQQQINSNTIVNVVSADRLRENPDANAVEAIGRLPGVSVNRSGGEGNSLLIRGMGGAYTTITMNGVKLPSTGSDRSTDISGIPQNMLQGVELFKSNTADMDGDAVAGTINLKLREAPTGFHSNILTQGGYNAQNNDYGNYKFAGEVSNRFLKKKLGIYFSGNIERVDRSTQNYSANYDYSRQADPNIGYLTGLNMNINNDIKYRRSLSLAMDYRLSSSTKLSFYSMYNYLNDNNSYENKNYGATGNGSVGYSLGYNPYYKQNVYFNTLNGQTNLNFLNTVLEYGISYSKTIQSNPDSRSWNFYFTEPMTSTKFDNALTLTLDPKNLKSFYKDNDSLDLSKLSSIGRYSSTSSDLNISPYLDVKVPYKFSNKISGYIKFGGKYIRKERYTDVNTGNQVVETNIDFVNLVKNEFNGLSFNRQQPNQLSIDGLQANQITNFLHGTNFDHNYGWYFDFKKLNQITDWWNTTSTNWWNKGNNQFLYQNGGPFGGPNRLYYVYDINGSSVNNENIQEDQKAAYVMSEFNYDKWFTFIPGVRYENVDTKMKGWFTESQSTQFNMLGDFPKTPTKATNKNDYLLPMIQARFRPSKNIYFHLSYTQALRRPNFTDISPNTFVYAGFGGLSKTMKNPDLKPELWTNIDAQMTIHSPKVGLFSITGFHKKVQNAIVYWNYTRIKGDSIIKPFTNNDEVNVSYVTNHDFNIYLQGIEVEWQTSFYYLPGFLKYFVLTLNYSYTDSKTQYWTYRNVPGPPDSRGRPGPSYRDDSLRTDRMSGIPTNVANATLGFEKKYFKAFISYQYTGNKHYINARIPQWDQETLPFNRIDMQVSYALPDKKLKGTFIIFANFANLTNVADVNKYVYNPRITNIAAYGWTADLGLRFKF